MDGTRVAVRGFGEYVPVQEAARASGISPKALQKRINRGRLPAVWAGGRWWVRQADIAGFHARRAKEKETVLR